MAWKFILRVHFGADDATCYLFLRINFQTEFNSADDDGERYNLYQHKPTRHVASINAMHMSFSKGINKIYWMGTSSYFITK